MSYRNGKNDHVTLSLEGQIVRNANRLDAIGAIGVARTFQLRSTLVNLCGQNICH